jgi:hypothetical protein
MRASRWDLKPAGKVKASHSVTLCIGEIPSLVVFNHEPGASPAHHMLTWQWWSLSVHVETRKMVNYAWAG